jgi:Domain of unknown function (DUF4403)
LANVSIINQLTVAACLCGLLPDEKTSFALCFFSADYTKSARIDGCAPANSLWQHSGKALVYSNTMFSQRSVTLLLFFALLAVISCNRVRPKAPDTQPFEPAIVQTTSYVVGDVTFNLRDLERKINQSLQMVLVTEETFKGKKGEAWQLRVERTGPVRVRYARQRVSFSAPLRVWISNPIGLRKKRRSHSIAALFVRFDSPISVGENWRLNTRTRFVDYRWIERPAIRVLGLKISVTALADNVLQKRQADIESAIDNAVHQSLRLDRQIINIWLDLQKPLLISTRPDTLWIIPNPTGIATAPIRGNEKTITVPVQISFLAYTRIGAKPLVRLVQRLPRLHRLAQLLPSSRVQMLAFVPYTDLNRILKQTLEKEKLNLVGGKLAINSASVYGGGRSLILKTEVGGAVKGTLYFHGQPVYDTLDNTLRIKGLDFDLETKEALVSTADWLLHDHLRDTLQAVLAVPLGQQIGLLPAKIETAFARGKAGRKTTLSINNFRFVPQQIVIRPNGIQVLVAVKSRVALRVKRL